MRRDTYILILALSVLAGCSTTRKSSEISVTGPAAVITDAAAAKAAETLAAIQCRCDSVEGNSPWVKFLRLPEQLTHQPQFDVLCKSGYPATVTINGQAMKQYKTGIFFSTLTFTEG